MCCAVHAFIHLLIQYFSQTENNKTTVFPDVQKPVLNHANKAFPTAEIKKNGAVLLSGA